MISNSNPNMAPSPKPRSAAPSPESQACHSPVHDPDPMSFIPPWLLHERLLRLKAKPEPPRRRTEEEQYEQALFSEVLELQASGLSHPTNPPDFNWMPTPQSQATTLNLFSSSPRTPSPFPIQDSPSPASSSPESQSYHSPIHALPPMLYLPPSELHKKLSHLKARREPPRWPTGEGLCRVGTPPSQTGLSLWRPSPSPENKKLFPASARHSQPTSSPQAQVSYISPQRKKAVKRDSRGKVKKEAISARKMGKGPQRGARLLWRVSKLPPPQIPAKSTHAMVTRSFSREFALSSCLYSSLTAIDNPTENRHSP